MRFLGCNVSRNVRLCSKRQRKAVACVQVMTARTRKECAEVIYITGDTHRDFERVGDLAFSVGSTVDDVMVILGDAGINYYGEPEDSELKAHLSELPISLLCIHGNHEMRPESIGTYEEKEWRGGIVYYEANFPDLLFAKDGEIYDLESRSCIAIGGAYSVDKYLRMLSGTICWWPDEQPSEEIMQNVEARLEAEGWKIDIVLSHTCPNRYIPRHAFLPFIAQGTVDNSTEEWLDYIESKLSYDHWFCGHFHTNETVDNIRFMFEDIIDL